MRLLITLALSITAYYLPLVTCQSRVTISSDGTSSRYLEPKIDRSVNDNQLYGYLLANDSSTDSMHLKKIMKYLHDNQHPPKASCKTRRLLITQFIQGNFEGLGSIIKVIMMGVAEAAHSNRTLIWGLDLPLMFERARDEWYNKDLSEEHETFIKGFGFDCGSSNQGGGPYGCFFEKLSTCSIEDISDKDVKILGENGFDDNNRVKFLESRRGASVYHFPAHDPSFTKIFTKKDNVKYKRHKWASAIAAYVFRIKSSVLDLIESRKLDVWPLFLGGNSVVSCGRNCPDKVEEKSPIIWSFHVRHGDVKALKDVYGNRKLFEFTDFMSAAKIKVRKLIEEERYADLPSAIYISSDSVEIADYIENTCNKGIFDWPQAPMSGSIQSEIRSNSIPCIFAVDYNDRFRTAHGSHTVAADGGCNSKSCALWWHDIQHYQQHGELKDKTTGERLMITLFEAIEDMYLLSYTDNLICQMSSHFSTLASLLIWARTGATDPHIITFLDLKAATKGNTECSFLHGQTNGTTALAHDQGFERWISHTRRFLEGFSNLNGLTNTQHTIAENVDLRVGLKDLIPCYPDDVFDKESRRWSGGRLEKGYPVQIWSGECPLHNKDHNDVSIYIANLINWGAEQSNVHPNQAMLCWKEASVLLYKCEVKKTCKIDESKFKDYNEILRENIKALQGREMFPFSLGIKKVQEILQFQNRRIFNDRSNRSGDDDDEDDDEDDE